MSSVEDILAEMSARQLTLIGFLVRSGEPVRIAGVEITARDICREVAWRGDSFAYLWFLLGCPIKS